MFTILQILLPVFSLILLGAVLRKGGFMDQAMEAAFNKFCYYVALPVFLFIKAAQSPAQSPAMESESLKTAGALMLVTGGLMLSGWIMALLIRLPKRSVGTFVQAAFRGNLAYTGLPVIAFALLGENEALRQHAESVAILTMAPGVLIYNLLGVMVLEWDRRHEISHHPLKSWLFSTAKNPLIISCAAGFLWHASPLPLPDLLIRIGLPVASTAFPLALMAIGARIAVLDWRQSFLTGFMLCVVKNGIGLLLGLAICHWLDLQGIHRLIILVLSVCPTAVASYVLVDQLDGDRDLAASTIALTTFSALFSLAGALYLGLPI